MTRIARRFALRALGLASREAHAPRAVDGVPTFQELRPLFERELRRARRYERPFSILVFCVNDGLDETERDHSIARLGALLQDSLRETDLACHVADRGEALALMPEADAATALHAAERVRCLWAAENTVTLVAGAATYPADGLTLDHLLASGRRSSLDVTVGLNGRNRKAASG